MLAKILATKSDFGKLQREFVEKEMNGEQLAGQCVRAMVRYLGHG